LIGILLSNFLKCLLASFGVELLRPLLMVTLHGGLCRAQGITVAELIVIHGKPRPILRLAQFAPFLVARRGRNVSMNYGLPQASRRARLIILLVWFR